MRVDIGYCDILDIVTINDVFAESPWSFYANSIEYNDNSCIIAMFVVFKYDRHKIAFHFSATIIHQVMV